MTGTRKYKEMLFNYKEGLVSTALTGSQFTGVFFPPLDLQPRKGTVL